MQIGQICTKIAGRDAGQKCVVLTVPKDSMVLIDGQTRRRNCNICHLWPAEQRIEITENASHEDVVNAFKELGIEIKEKVKKDRKPSKSQDKKAESKQEEK